MNKKRTFVKGTIILIIAGLITKIIGFFFRIFLSRTLGAEGLGIYQLIFPIQGFCYSLCCAGIQTIISQRVASCYGKNPNHQANQILKAGLFLSVTISIICALILNLNADFIATYILSEKRCIIPLQLLSYSIPFSSIHTCICGYYYGKNKALIPAWSQFLEQIVRVITIYIIWMIQSNNGYSFTPANAVIGSITGEIFSALFCILSLNILKINNLKTSYVKIIARASVPLTSNRVMLSIFQSIEAVILPLQLRQYGLSVKASLSIYGILVGMALPFILFPATITTSMSTLLLPAIAKADSSQNTNQIAYDTEFSIYISLVLGIFFTGIFTKFGSSIGTIIFNNKTTGIFMMTLAWLCPFIYLSTTLSSILNGLGHTSTTFIINMISITIRILFIFLVVPRLGIAAYLCALLLSQIIMGISHFQTVRKYIDFKIKILKNVLYPGLCTYLSINISNIMFFRTSTQSLLILLSKCGISLFIFIILIIIPYFKKKELLH